MMANPTSALPDFASPPVTETALSVEFAPIEEWSPVSLGLFWATIRAEYPEHEIVPPLTSQIEKFGEDATAPKTLRIELGAKPDVRGWFVDESGTKLIQVQSNRFVSNWRKVLGDESYPRYSNTRAMFVREWSRFCDFLNSEGIASPKVLQCEVSYFNHIERGRGWTSTDELRQVVPLWSGKHSGEFLPDPEAVSLTSRYLMPDNKGRLHIVLQPAIRAADAKEVLQLHLIARGQPEFSSMEGILAWLDMGREWVVKGFTDFTTPEMHRLWGRRT